MKYQLATVICIGILSFNSNAADVDCKAAVSNGTQIMKDAMKDKNNFMYKMLSDPKHLAKGVKRCESDIKTEQGKAEWGCQQHATNMAEIEACEA